MSDFDKVRVYRCLCGSAVVRPLRGEPKVCDHCQGDLRYVCGASSIGCGTAPRRGRTVSQTRVCRECGASGILQLSPRPLEAAAWTPVPATFAPAPAVPTWPASSRGDCRTAPSPAN
jgi:hypothetical protein